MSRSNVPATYLELAALSAESATTYNGDPGPVGAGDEEKRSLSEKRLPAASGCDRARCVSEVVGERYAAIGRRAFKHCSGSSRRGEPSGLPAGDFVLLVPRVGDGDRLIDDRYGAVGDGAGDDDADGSDRPR